MIPSQSVTGLVNMPRVLERNTSLAFSPVDFTERSEATAWPTCAGLVSNVQPKVGSVQSGFRPGIVQLWVSSAHGGFNPWWIESRVGSDMAA